MKSFTLLIITFILAAVGPVMGQSGRTLLREGNDQYSEEKYSDAEVSYRKALESVDDVDAGRFNLGDALYEQGRFDEAVGQYENVLASTREREIRAKAYHNIGNSNLKNKKLEESITAYKEALKLNPKDEDTRYNLEYAKRLLQQQQQQQQQDNKDQDEDDKKQEKEDNKEQKQDEEQKKDQQKKDQQKQDQQQQKNEKPENQPQKPKDRISKADAERILEALKKQEQDLKKKLQKKVPVRVKTDKDW